MIDLHPADQPLADLVAAASPPGHRRRAIDMPGEIGGLVAHGWDVARADATVHAVHDVVAGFPDEARGGAFGPAIRLDADASLLARVIALTGRDPSWSASDRP